MNKDQKIEELLRELAATFFSKESNRQSLITITHVEIMSKGSRALLRFTVLPESEQERALEFVRRKLGEFRKYVEENSKIARIPYFYANLDVGEMNRQKIDEIGRNI